MPRDYSFSVASRLFALLFVALVSALRASEARLVPLEQYSASPFRSVGQVQMFEPYSSYNVAYGSGVAVGRHVVLSAAHVFYAGDRLGWRQTHVEWYSRRAVMATGGAQRPRAFRVLAGYADAVSEYSPGDGRASLEEFNRDAVCLLFYAPATEEIAFPAVNSIHHVGDNLLAGYPARLRVGNTVSGRMYASGGPGTRANFRPLGDLMTDREGRRNEVYETADLASGPGGSGGPLFTSIDGEWKVAGILVAGSADFSALAVRAVDAELGAMIDSAVAATSPESPGNEIWSYPIDAVIYRVTADDQVVVADHHQVTLLDSGGLPLWTTSRDFLGVVDLALAPDGTIYLQTIRGVFALDGRSGWMRWEYPGRSGNEAKLAVGDDSFVYVVDEWDDRAVSALSPTGKLAWKTSLPYGLIGGSRSRPVVGTDGHVLVPVGDALYSLRRSDGAVRWQIKPVAEAPVDRLAVGPTGTIHTAVGNSLFAISPDDGRILWSAPDSGYLTDIAIGADGTIAAISLGGISVKRWTKDGVRLAGIDRPTTSLAQGADGVFYIGFGSSLVATELDGRLVWTFPLEMSNPVLGSQAVIVGMNHLSGIVRVVRTSRGAGSTWAQSGGNPGGANCALPAQPLAPVITVQPVNQRVAAGEGLGLYVEAHGSSTLRYQWFHNGAPMAGQVSAVLQLATVTPADAGNYTVEVTNAVGATRSTPASVVIGSSAPGTIMWSKSFSETTQAIVSRDGVTYVNGRLSDGLFSRGAIFAYGNGGVLLWTCFYDDGTYIAELTTMAAVEGGGLVAVISGRLISFAHGGKIVWQFPLPGGATGLAIGPGGQICVSGLSGVSVYSPGGVLLWERKGPMAFFSSQPLAVGADGEIYHAITDAIVAYDALGGEIWRYVQPGNIALLGFDHEGALYASTGERLLRLDKAGRLVAATSEIGYASRFAIADDGTIFVSGLGQTSALRRVGGTFQVLARKFAGTLAGVTADGLALVFAEEQGTFLADSAGNVVVTLSTSPVRAATLAPSGAVLLVGGPFQVVASGRVQAASGWPTAGGANGNSYRAQRARTPPSVSFASGVVFGRVGGALVLEPAIDGSELSSVTWTKDGQPIVGARGVRLVLDEATPATAGLYRVTATSVNGATASATVQVTIDAAVTQAGWYSGVTSAGTPVFAFVDPAGRATILSSSFVEGNPLDATLAHDGSFAIASAGLSGVFSPVGGTMAAGALIAQVTRHAGSRFTLYRGSLLPDSESEVCLVQAHDGKLFWWLQTPDETTAFGYADWDPVGRQAIDAAGAIIARAADGGIRGTLRIGNARRPFFCFGPAPIEESRLVNISSRCFVAINGEPMIAGFVITGRESQRTLLRAIGPALRSFGVVQAPEGTSLRLYSGQQYLAENTVWWQGRDAIGVRSESSRLGAFPLPEFGADSALATTLAPGLYSLSVRPEGNRSGVTLAEVYEGGTASAPLERVRLMNISTRASIGTGERALFVGFVVQGATPLRVLVRAVGPGLGAYRVSAFAEDPRLALYRGEEKIFENDNWHSIGPALVRMRRAEREVGAFPLAQSSNDAAAVLNLEPGLYSVVVAPNDGRSGTALIEIYALPPATSTPVAN